jgi:phytoene desaturase
MQKHINKYFTHPFLRQLMSFPILFLGAMPDKTPALYSLMNYADIQGGTWYPEGGMYSIVEAMESLAKELGVTFSYNDEAREIRLEKNNIKKVVTAKAAYIADVVVSSADYHFTETFLLPEAFRSYSEAFWQKRH